jgi:hypothetical protein
MTDIADEIALLFDLGARNTIVIGMSIFSKDVLQFIHGLGYPWQEFEG